MHCFVTGATGFLGSFLVRELLDRGHGVTVLLRPVSDAWRIADILDRVQVVECAVERAGALRESLKAAKPDVVLHLAWGGVENEARNDIAQFDNVKAALWLAEAAVAAKVKVFVAAGSQAEYGPANRPLDESQPLEPTTLYGEAKVAAYLALKSLCRQSGLRFAWLRVFSTYGPKDNGGWLIPFLIDKLRKGEKPSLTGCEQRWDFLYVEDAAKAFALVAETGEASGAFNLGSGEGLPLLETVTTLRNLIAPKTPLGIGEIAYRPDQIMHLEADISRLTSLTGWRPATPLRAGLEKTIGWNDDRSS